MIDKLQELEQQGIIRAIDYQFGKLMYSISADPLLALVATNVSFELGQGNVCMSFADDFRLFGMDERETEWLVQATAIPKHQWLASLKNTPVVSDGSTPTPLIVDHERLYLYRYWQYESNIAHFIQCRNRVCLDTKEANTILQRLFQRDYPAIIALCKGQSAAVQKELLISHLDIEDVDRLDWHAILKSLNEKSNIARLTQLVPEVSCLNWQKIAVALAASRSFAVISGGPGTGKTTTVSKLLVLLIELGLKVDSPPKIKLVAPTGKAAARLTESIGGAIEKINCSQTVRARMPVTAVTLHRLLGATPQNDRFVYNRKNRLHLDILVVDEASMIDLQLMSHLLDALPEHGRLILLGDRDQLASVEAGSVLGDICFAIGHGYSKQQSDLLEQLTGYSATQLQTVQSDACDLEKANLSVSDNLCLLRKSYRFHADSGIGSLAKAVNSGDMNSLVSVMKSDYEDIEFFPVVGEKNYQYLIQRIIENYQYYLGLVQQQAEPNDIIDAFNRFQLLCAVREGPFGITGLNQEIEKALQRNQLISIHGQWYEGRPILITRNDPGLNMNNGDIGIVIRTGDHRLRVAFQTPDRQINTYLPSRLPEHETVFAMTIHKSQGSEFLDVMMVLPDKYSPVMTRELVYTGITRAKSKFTLFSEMDIIRQATGSPSKRQSGLCSRLMQSN